MDGSGVGGGGGSTPGVVEEGVQSQQQQQQQATFTVNLSNLPFQFGSDNGNQGGGSQQVDVGSSVAQGGVGNVPGNIGRVMQDIWPQIEQRIAQQALAALRDRGGGATGVSSHTHSHEGHTHMPHNQQHTQPAVNLGHAPQQNDDGQFVINIGGGGGGVGGNNNPPLDVNQNTDGNQGQPGGVPQGPPQQQGQPQIPTVRAALKAMEGSLPFIFLMLAKVLYNHRLGILVFVGLFGTFFHANSSLRRLVAQRESRNWADSLGGLTWIVALLGANIFFIYYVFEDQSLYRSLYLGLPDLGEGVEMDLWNLLWITGVNDFVVKYATIILKALVALMPRQILPAKKKGKYFMLLEMLSQFYRSALPIIPWVHFLQNAEHGGQWFSIVLLVLFLIAKGNHILHKFWDVTKAVGRFKVDVSYGSVPSRDQLQQSDNSCPICQDKFTDPVLLSCRHIFCEDCVSMWFDRERTCPMCRANIVDNPQWRDGTTAQLPQLY